MMATPSGWIARWEAVLSDLYQSKLPSRVEAFRILKPLEPTAAASEPMSAPDPSDLPAPPSLIAEEDLYDDFVTNAAGEATVNVRLSAPQIAALKQGLSRRLLYFPFHTHLGNLFWFGRASPLQIGSIPSSAIIRLLTRRPIVPTPLSRLPPSFLPPPNAMTLQLSL